MLLLFSTYTENKTEWVGVVWGYKVSKTGSPICPHNWCPLIYPPPQPQRSLGTERGDDWLPNQSSPEGSVLWPQGLQTYAVGSAFSWTFSGSVQSQHKLDRRARVSDTSDSIDAHIPWSCYSQVAGERPFSSVSFPVPFSGESTYNSQGMDSDRMRAPVESSSHDCGFISSS